MPQGVEFGEGERIDFVGRKPKLSYPAAPRFASFIGRVNAILAGYPAFRCGENCRFVDDGHPSVIAAFRQEICLFQEQEKQQEKQGAGFLVVCNFDTHSPQRIVVDLAPFLGTDGPFPCCELLSGETQLYPHPRLDILLPPCAAQVLMFPRSSESVPFSV